MFWTTNDDTIELALRVKTSGFIGFGIGEQTTGGMGGADIVTVAVLPNGTAVVTDRYSLGNELPLADTCQDWKLVSASEANGVTTVELLRALKTGDPQDNDIVRSHARTKVIVSYGQADEVSYHGATRYAFQVDFFGGAVVTLDLDAMNADKTVGYFDLTANNVILPVDGICISGADCYDAKTTYYETCRDVSEMRDAYIIAFLSLVEGSEAGNPELHHFVVWGHDTPDCASGTGEFVYGWAPGAKEVVFPKDVGIRLGPGGTQSFRIQIHYDNPHFKRNRHDSSGVRFYYSTVPRKHEAGVIVLGDLYMALNGQELPKGLSRFEMSCPDAFDACDAKDKEPITVFFSQLHMHKTGVKMTSQRRRPDGKLETAVKGEFFNFGFQDSNLVTYTISPGEEFITTCFYDNKGSTVKWGLGSNDEMCQNFVGYYPKKKCLGPACGLNGAGGKLLNANATQLQSDRDLNRTFGAAPKNTCPALPSKPSKPATATTGQPATATTGLAAAKPAVSSSPSLRTASPLAGLAALAVFARLRRL